MIFTIRLIASRSRRPHSRRMSKIRRESHSFRNIVDRRNYCEATFHLSPPTGNRRLSSSSRSRDPPWTTSLFARREHRLRKHGPRRACSCGEPPLQFLLAVPPHSRTTDRTTSMRREDEESMPRYFTVNGTCDARLPVTRERGPCAATRAVCARATSRRTCTRVSARTSAREKRARKIYLLSASASSPSLCREIQQTPKRIRVDSEFKDQRSRLCRETRATLF